MLMNKPGTYYLCLSLSFDALNVRFSHGDLLFRTRLALLFIFK